MAFFSATCPTIPAEQVRAEIEAMSREEFQLLQDDLHDRRRDPENDQPPTSSAVTSSSSIVPGECGENALLLLQEALDGLPPLEKEAYEKARALDAALITRESDPHVFLRQAEHDCWKAAQDLASYWKLRWELFGAEKALQPMTQNGALRDDTEILYAPSVTMTPPVGGGRFTFHSDRSRLVEIKGGSRSVFLRIVFYLFQKMAFSEGGERGFAAVFNMKSYDFYKHHDRKYVKKMVEISRVMPITMRAAHMCTGSGVGVMKFLMPVFFALMPQSYRYRVVLHAGADAENLDAMAKYGITCESVPTRLGGSFSDERFREWLAKEKRIEAERD